MSVTYQKLYATLASAVPEKAAHFGWSFQNVTAISTNQSNNDISRASRIYETLLERQNVDMVHGRAFFVDAHTVGVGEERYRADKILIATGGQPFVPEIPGTEFISVSDDFFRWTTVPASVTVVGGGYIGVELASILSRLGAQVSLVHRGERLLRGFDEDIRTEFTQRMADSNIDLRLQTQVEQVTSNGEMLSVQLTEAHSIACEKVIFATGRTPNTKNLNLQAAGIEIDDRNAIIVDENFQTTAPHVFAVGDVINRVQLTPVALAEAMQVVDILTRNPRKPLDYTLVPTAVFSHPEIATVGLTEADAQNENRRIEVYEARFRPLHEAMAQREQRAYLKMIVCAETGLVLGCHMLGEHAAEIIQGMAVALTAGATKDHFDRTLGIHPTIAEEWVTLRTPRKTDEKA